MRLPAMLHDVTRFFIGPACTWAPGLKMPVGAGGSRNGGGQAHDPSREAKLNGDDESSNSDGETSSYDEEDGERRKGDCLDDMQFLEQQFTDLKELLYHERVVEAEKKIHMVAEGDAPEYQQPLMEQEEALQLRISMAELQHKSQIENIQNKYAEECQSAQQDFEEVCRVTLLRMQTEVKEKIARLREERVMAKLASENPSRKRKGKIAEFLLPEKRKKPVTVTGPCVVYTLRDMDVMEDLNDLRKGRAALEVQRRSRLGGQWQDHLKPSPR